MRVGFIGLGNMGLPMALNLLKAGFQLVVFNRTRAKARELEEKGAEVAASRRELTERSDVVLACLADIPASLEAFLGKDGIVEAARRGQVLADHATVDLGTSLKVHRAASQRGACFLDAPISGGPLGAAAGSLSIMAGGEAAAFARALPVFEAMGKTVLHMGEAGTGTAAKLANQLLVGIHTVAACEALLLAEKAGVNLEKLVFLLERSWGQSRMLERNAENVIGRRLGPSAVPVRNLVKDLTIITALGREHGLRLALAGAAHEAFAALQAAGKGDWDIAAASLLVEGKSSAAGEERPGG